ncbi:MAG: PIN domain-containing protein [Brevundimonas sp.]|uniref:PIN domain-containing protein n=1 Tax=Brevundimonas sp. TaxID=1871086 RepID=UPI00391BC849
MTALCFLDTNILLYLNDDVDARKRELSQHIVLALAETRGFVVSPQVLNEYYNVAIGKPGQYERRHVYRENVRRFSAACTAPFDEAVRETAWDFQEITNYHWWDLLIIASASRAGCRYLLTEDMHHGHELGDLTVVNPFFAEPSELFEKLDIPAPLFPLED